MGKPYRVPDYIIADCDPESMVTIGDTDCANLKDEGDSYWYSVMGNIRHCVVDLGCKHTFGGIKIINYVTRVTGLNPIWFTQEGSTKKLREVQD